MDKDNQERKFFEELKNIRESHNIDLNDISDKTKINIRYLELIEKGDFDALPNIYVRLFIRSYAEYLGANPKLTLIEYDKFTNTSPKEIFKRNKKKQTKIIDDNKPEIIFSKSTSRENNISEDEKNIEENRNKAIKGIQQSKLLNSRINKDLSSDKINKTKEKEAIDQQYFYSPINILKIFVSFSFITSIYLIISFLSKEQAENIRGLNNAEPEEILSNRTNYLVTDNLLLNNDNFLEKNLVTTKSFKIKHEISLPYILQIVTKDKTKLYISHDNDVGSRIEDCNKIVPKDSLLKFENKNNIYFDLWNAQHVEISINNKPISKYFGNDEALIRGSFEPRNRNLYLEFYSY